MNIYTRFTIHDCSDMSHNTIADIPHGTFKTPHGLSHLRELDLSYNDITSLETGMFEGLTSLKKL